MSKTVKHIVLPFVPVLAVIALYFTPLTLLGCVARGLAALAVVTVTLLAALVTVGVGLSKRIKGEPDSAWWIISTVIFTVPALLVLGPLG